MGEASEPPSRPCSFGNQGALDRKELSLSQSVRIVDRSLSRTVDVLVFVSVCNAAVPTKRVSNEIKTSVVVMELLYRQTDKQADQGRDNRRSLTSFHRQPAKTCTPDLLEKIKDKTFVTLHLRI
jgi:predicted P-loop ATPase/GTPase